MFGMCLQDCDRVLMLDPTSRNASLCRIKALSHLANISEITGPTEELPQLLQSIERLKKEVEGNFDFEQIYKQNLNLKQQRLYDHFDFVGPIAIQQLSPDKGRGLVAADDFTAGQLIMATKALECAFHSDKLCEHESPMDEVVQRLTDRCLIDGEALRELLKLYAGPDVELLNEVKSFAK